MKSQIDQAIALLAPRAAEFAATLEDARFIVGVEAIEEATDFCPACAEKRIAGLESDEVLICNGSQEVDSHPTCADCCVGLNGGMLTDYGVEYELDHFEDAEINLTAADCWYLTQLLEAVPYVRSEKLKQAGDRLAARLLAAAYRRGEVAGAEEIKQEEIEI